MVLELGDWKFHVFDVTNRKYYAEQYRDRCDCAWCRNFYKAVDDRYPNLRRFMEQFGLRLDAPDEMIAFTPTLCSNYYAVCGSILERGAEPITVDGITVEPQLSGEAMVNTTLDPVFFLYVGCMELPWVLDEPMEQADSPARRKNPIQRLLSQWITEI